MPAWASVQECHLKTWRKSIASVSLDASAVAPGRQLPEEKLDGVRIAWLAMVGVAVGDAACSQRFLRPSKYWSAHHGASTPRSL